MQVIKEKKEEQRELSPEGAIKRGIPIAQSLHLNTWHRYRELGKLLLESGYRKGRWHSYHRLEAERAWQISQQRFSEMVRLGEMSEREFTDIVGRFSTFRNWVHNISLEEKKAREERVRETRKNIRTALLNKYPEQRKQIKEILRDEKPYLKKEDDISEYFSRVLRSGEDPLTVFSDENYLEFGEGRGWKVKLQYWVKLGLQKISFDEQLGLTPEQYLMYLAKDEIAKKGITREDLVNTAKAELRDKWLISTKDIS